MIPNKRKVPSQIPLRRPTALTSPRSSPTPYRPSLPDKPLPSLPVATIVSKSPVQRRSLIDATERTLVRRSLSPQFGQADTEEWPALSPVRPLSSAGQRPEATTIKPSVGESVIEGMRHLNLGDVEEGDQQDSNVCDQETNAGREPRKNHMLQPRSSTPSSLKSPSTTSVHPASSVESVSPTDTTSKQPQSNPDPTVRQTKTSAMRMRLPGGSMDGDDLEFDQDDKRNAPNGGNHSASRIGPVRSGSRGRHTATPRGSPYLIPSESKAKLIQIRRKPVATPDTNCSRQNARSGSTDSTEELRGSQLVAVKSVKRSISGKRSASIPLPSRLIRRLPEEDSEGEVEAPKPRKPREESAQLDHDSQDADIDTEPEPKSRSTSQLNGHSLSSHPVKQQSNLFSFSEIMTTTPPAADESRFSSDSEDGSVRGYDEDGGFKIKQLRSNGKTGATLRISDDAHHLLSPDHEGDDDDDEPVPPKNRTSITDLRQAVVLKEHFRRSGDLIKAQVQLTRSITERSLARLSGVSSQDGDARSESEYSVPDNGGISDEVQPSPVELPAEPAAPNGVTSTPAHAQGQEATDEKTIDTPSSAGQGDWPLKDFKTFAAVTPTPTEASLSPWIPPPDWDVALPEGDNSMVSEDTGTPYPPAQHNTPATQPGQQVKQRQSSERMNDANGRIPTPTPSRFSGTGSKASSTDPVKRPYPARSSSKQNARQNFPVRAPSNLSPVKESPDRITGLRQPPKPYGNDLKVLPEPKYTRTFSQSIEDINQSLDAVRPTPSAAKLPAPTTSGKKAMSTLRGLFHKKSYEFRSGSRRGKRNDTGTTPKSSPLLATPTPFPKLPPSTSRGFSPLHLDGMTPARSKSVAQRKPIPAANTPVSTPAVDNATLQPPEIRLATQTALKLLDMAREERPGARQNQLVQVSTEPPNIPSIYFARYVLTVQLARQSNDRSRQRGSRRREGIGAGEAGCCAG